MSFQLFDALDVLLADFLRSPLLRNDKPSELLSNMVVLFEAKDGFTRAAEESRWGTNQVEFIESRLQGSRDANEFDESDFGGPHIVRFRYYALGFLLGHFESGRINELEFQIAELQLAGFIELHLGKLDAAFRPPNQS